ncbi:hypothetical protein EOPP23_14320 [Endozoicomonas sp. OPT23]|uniref:hypothetical protein n=1 Tax=Endozoicomonas sp. OPT23 TaxID=2072845 RepID=UPI00129A3EF1|nr:hypothetical protein [Endozoicomonas sp. OPT23]MRI34165.1 hypothetical protein [Endozoicomonas sp. OPT23]
MKRIQIVKVIAGAIVTLTVQSSLADTLCWKPSSSISSYRDDCWFYHSEPDSHENTFRGYVTEKGECQSYLRNNLAEKRFYWLNADEEGFQRIPVGVEEYSAINAIPYCPGIQNKKGLLTMNSFTENEVLCKAEISTVKKKTALGFQDDEGFCSNLTGAVYQFVKETNIVTVPGGGWACTTKECLKGNLGKLSGEKHGQQVRKQMEIQKKRYGSKDKHGFWMLGNYANPKNDGDGNYLFENINHIDSDREY